MKQAITAVLVLFLANSSYADVVLKDHITDSSNWNGIDALSDQVFSLTLADGDIGITAAFTGNGQTLKSVGAIFAHDNGLGTPNLGTPTQMEFRISYFEDDASYIADPFAENVAAPDRLHIFSQATNPDWLTQVGTSADGHHLFHWEFDIESLGIQTVAGQESFISIIPETNFVSGAAFIALSRGTAGSIGSNLDWGRSDPSDLGPDTLTNLGAPYGRAAYRVTTVAVPEPGAFCMLLLVTSIYAMKRFATKL